MFKILIRAMFLCMALNLFSGQKEKLEVGSDNLSHVVSVSSLKNFKLEQNDYRIYYIGDSITRHGFNKNTIEKLKWGHVAGMAASSEEKDYAHLLATRIQKELTKRKVKIFFGPGHDARIAQLGLNRAKQFQPHLVIVQLGEHAKPAGSYKQTQQDYENLTNKLLQLRSKPLILCTGVWAPGTGDKYKGWAADVERIQRTVCKSKNISFASVEKYALNKRCRGTGGSPGVRWHPNDQGMEGYAKELFELWQKNKQRNSKEK